MKNGMFFTGQRLGAIVMVCALAGGCASVPSQPSKSGKSAGGEASKGLEDSEEQQLLKWAANLSLVEWQVARLAASCNEVATTTQSPIARREALRLKAAFATSSYAILSGRNVLVQVLDCLAMAALFQQVWIEEGRAASEFGAQSRLVETAVEEIQERTRLHALRHLSADELREVEEMVRTWRRTHPGPVVAEFIRFEAFADEIARSFGKDSDLGGLFGKIAGGAHNVELLGERAVFLTMRMPRLAEWHAEAAAANVLAQPDLTEALTALKRLGELQLVLPERLKALQALESRLTSMPDDLAGALAGRPELKEALSRVEQTGQQVKALEDGVAALQGSVSALTRQLAELTSATQPAVVEQLAEKAGGALLRQARSLLLLATVCAVGVVILQALLRRWSTRRYDVPEHSRESPRVAV